MTPGENKRLYMLMSSNEWRETMGVWLAEREAQLIEILLAKGGEEYRHRVQEVRNLLALKDSLVGDFREPNKTVD